MKIKANKLKKFFKKVHVDGLNHDVLLNFAEDKLMSRAVDPSDVVLVNVSLDKKAFKTYKAIGEVGFKDIDVLIKILDSFGDSEIDIDLNENLFTMKSKNEEAEDLLPKPEFIPKPSANPELKYEAFEKVKTESFKKAKDDFTLLKAGDYKLQIEKGVLTISCGKERKKRHNIELKTIKKDGKIRFAQAFSNVIATLDKDDIEIGIADEYPITIREKDTELEVEYIIAPLEN